jgi:hypothetical protein
VRQACNNASSDRVGNIDEDDWDCAALARECGDRGSGLDQDHVGVLLDNLLCKAHTINITCHPTIIDPDIAPVRPTKRLERLAECRSVLLPFRIVCTPHPNGDLRQSAALLRARSARPRDDRAAEERYELPPPHVPLKSRSQTYHIVRRPTLRCAPQQN